MDLNTLLEGVDWAEGGAVCLAAVTATGWAVGVTKGVEAAVGNAEVLEAARGVQGSELGLFTEPEKISISQSIVTQFCIKSQNVLF